MQETNLSSGDLPPVPGTTASSGRRLSNTELSSFCGQMALVLKSGISAYEGLTIMRDDAGSDEDRELLSRLVSGMEQSGFFSPALRESGLFPDYLVNMVEIGERTGNLDTVMKSLEAHYEREEAIRRSTKNAIFYPLILTAMMIVVILVLLIYVMPVFNDVFLSLGAEMTGLPAFLMTVGTSIRTYSVLFLIIVACVILAAFLLGRTERGQALLRKMGRSFPSVRNSNHAASACRFASAMSMTLSAGLTPEESMELTGALNEDPDFGAKLSTCQQELLKGRGFADSLHEAHIFSGIYARMLSIGQKTGSMDQVMGQIADMYQDEIDTRVNNRLATLEPLLVILMSAAIGVILLTVMFPLLGLMSSI